MKKGININNVRMPVEPLRPYFKKYKLCLWKISWINVAKNIVLRLLAAVEKKKWNKIGIEVPSDIFFCIMFTGKMSEKKVLDCLPNFIEKAVKENRNIEVLFHPGGLASDWEYLNEERPTFVEFYTFENRKREKDTCLQLKNKIKEG